MTKWPDDLRNGWDRFWFAPRSPETLAAIRIAGGLMLLYTHFVWTTDLMAFVGPDSWIRPELSQATQADRPWAWSYLWHVTSPGAIWTLHIIGLLVYLMVIAGVFTRVTTALAWVITISYCHRLTGALFGLDQVNAMLALYLMIGRSGDAYSVDAWWRKRKGQLTSSSAATVRTNIAIRLIQLHLCVIYLFGGIGKMRGITWWDGTAVWFAFASLEYQSLDMTWLSRHPYIVNTLGYITIFWETFYCAIVWPRWSRPIALTLAVLVHGGIAISLGMITFGIAMIIVNSAFIESETTDHYVKLVTNRLRGNS